MSADIGDKVHANTRLWLAHVAPNHVRISCITFVWNHIIDFKIKDQFWFLRDKLLFMHLRSSVGRFCWAQRSWGRVVSQAWIETRVQSSLAVFGQRHLLSIIRIVLRWRFGTRWKVNVSWLPPPTSATAESSALLARTTAAASSTPINLSIIPSFMSSPLEGRIRAKR